MQALDRKLLRDFRRLWVQALAIALVLACGVAVLLTAFGMYQALNDTREVYYSRNSFADIFATASRVPESLLPEVTAISGILAADARVSNYANLDIPGRTKGAVGRLLSLPEVGKPRLNTPILRSGRWPMLQGEVVVNEPFALANGFSNGDRFQANLNGNKRELLITGTALSPEFIYTLGPGALMPDNETFGIIWMRPEEIKAAFDMAGAFNDLSVKIAHGVKPDEVIARLDTLLEPYGGQGAVQRDQHSSHAIIDAEITQLKGTAMVLPPIFFGIAAFLVSMVMGRIVALERSEIGLLKAVGYSDIEVCLHYLMLAALVAFVGIAIGWIAGGWLARLLAAQYARFFDFPFLIFRVSYWVYGLAALAALLTTTAGAARSALKAARLAPAIAMQPPAPPRFKHSLADDVMRRLRLSQPTVMILRSFLRWPVRSAMTVLGLALAVASVVSSSFLADALDEIVDTAFFQSNRQDAMLIFSNERPQSALEDVLQLPGVLQAEALQYATAILHNGPLSKRVSIEARKPGSDLSRIVASDGSVANAQPGGILLSERLAEQLQVEPGDKIEVQFTVGRRETRELLVTGIVRQYFGLGAYMDHDSLNALFRQSPQVSAVSLSLDDSQQEALERRLKDIPETAGLVMMTDMRRSFQEIIRQQVIVMNSVYITIAILITIGVAYNGARIQLSERARELASLRILGFSRGEVSYILAGEMMILALMAQPLGWVIGAWIAKLTTENFASDLYTIPLVLKPAAFSTASLIVLGAALCSVLIVRRRLDRMDLVAVMKTKE
ncbi:ABC transporter permease [Parasedimentitalea maritima]|uniref:FtsX-like permease family protein n=1 Tax=Parasedimentitalea maritima TaxID=2578117 RepID=A0A6A4R9T4_9RHOB|nr:FtsX-like permease family protein [Zongyanglinia marina]KAE9624729.1 FtsX-like permease family protein [Zongyanglinia marina]